MTRLPLLLLLVTIASGHPWAQAPQIKGTFTSKDVKFNVAGGVAFNDRSSLDRETPVILVAISNTGLNVDAVADFVDRRRAIEQLVKDDDPMKAVKITRGWATASKASLLVEGESSIGKVAGEVFLVNATGTWGVDEELVDIVIGR